MKLLTLFLLCLVLIVAFGYEGKHYGSFEVFVDGEYVGTTNEWFKDGKYICYKPNDLFNTSSGFKHYGCFTQDNIELVKYREPSNLSMKWWAKWK